MHKKFSLFSALVIGLIACVAFAANSDNHKIVKKVTFSNGVAYDGKNVPDDYKHLTDAITKEVSKATFEFREGTLLVGVDPAAKTEEVLNITWRSDCPVNSKFQVTSTATLAKAEEVTKTTLVAWTQVRHPALKENEVQKYTPQEKAWDKLTEVILKK